jgi:transcription factor IIIB subunit 2
MPRIAKEPPPRKPNPLRNRRPIIAPTPLIYQQAAAAAAAAAKAPARPARRACPNKTCSAPDVVDGICHNCGTIVDDSNIVSEVTFGESSNGAAVVQGSFVSADQGTAKSLGPAFRRAGGMEDRESTIREGKRPPIPLSCAALIAHRPKNYASVGRSAWSSGADCQQWSPNLQACCQ